MPWLTGQGVIAPRLIGVCDWRSRHVVTNFMQLSPKGKKNEAFIWSLWHWISGSSGLKKSNGVPSHLGHQIAGPALHKWTIGPLLHVAKKNSNHRTATKGDRTLVRTDQKGRKGKRRHIYFLSFYCWW
jgi:hypothetical protein